MLIREELRWPPNQWPVELFNKLLDRTARAQQADLAANGATLPLNEVRSAVVAGWLEAMLPAGNA